MNPVFIDKNYHVSPQIEPHQIAEIAEKGFVKIICNRPDVEVPDSYSSTEMAKLATEVGIDFEVLELTHQTMTVENVKKQREFFMPLITFREAIKQALAEEIERDENVCIMGEEVAPRRMFIEDNALNVSFLDA